MFSLLFVQQYSLHLREKCWASWEGHISMYQCKIITKICLVITCQYANWDTLLFPNLEVHIGCHVLHYRAYLRLLYKINDIEYQQYSSSFIVWSFCMGCRPPPGTKNAKSYWVFPQFLQSNMTGLTDSCSASVRNIISVSFIKHFDVLKTPYANVV